MPLDKTGPLSEYEKFLARRQDQLDNPNRPRTFIRRVQEAYPEWICTGDWTETRIHIHLSDRAKFWHLAVTEDLLRISIQSGRDANKEFRAWNVLLAMDHDMGIWRAIEYAQSYIKDYDG